LLPDIDNVNSKISNTNIFTKVISVFANLFLGHRELTHYPETFVVLCLLLLSGCFVSGNISPVVIGFLIGYGSHIVLDLLNPMGIRSAITKKRYSIARIKTGGACENLIFGLLVFIFFIII
jgi:inner membrane protein